MALSLPAARVAVTAVSTDLSSSATTTTTTSSPAAGPSGGSSADPAGAASSSAGTSVNPQGPVLRSRVSSAQPPPVSVNYPYQFTQPVSQRHGALTIQSGGIFTSKVRPTPNSSSALIDIEDCGDGSITFKYGALEDLWDLDRLLEFVCGGAFNIHTAETFVPVIVEIFKVPVSYTGQRRMVEMLSRYFSLDSNGFSTAEETEKMISQVLAEAASEFLPPSNVGSYSKGRARPCKRFSSREDKWWNLIDDYLGVGVGSIDFLPERSSGGLLEGYQMQQPSSNRRKHNTYERSRPKFSGSSNADVARFIWKDAPKSGMGDPPHRLPGSYAPKTPNLEVLREDDSSEKMKTPALEVRRQDDSSEKMKTPTLEVLGEDDSSGKMETPTLEVLREDDSLEKMKTPTLEGDYIPDLGGFVLRPSEADTPEGDALRKAAEVEVNGAVNGAGFREAAEVEVNAADSDHFASPLIELDTLPAASIQAMMEWEQEEDFVTSVSLPSKEEQCRVKVNIKKSTRRIKSKATTQRVRVNTGSRKSASNTVSGKSASNTVSGKSASNTVSGKSASNTISGKSASNTVTRKSASKSKKSTERRNEPTLYDLFFALPLSHKCSGVARFLQMRKTFSDEMLVVLNYAAVGLAAAGLASTLQLVARMLSVNATLDSAKVFAFVRSAALLCFSAAMRSLTKVMLRLPAGCTVSDLKDKTQVLCLQQRLRRLSFTALTVIVLSVFAPGV